MNERAAHRHVQTIYQLEVRCPTDRLTEALTLIRRASGDLQLHTCRTWDDGYVVECVCEAAEEAVLTLQEAGIAAELVTVVFARSEDRPGALGHLVQTIAAADVAVLGSYGASDDGLLRAVLRTTDNPRAEDALRAYLDLRG